jgi:hypothetical protein
MAGRLFKMIPNEVFHYTIHVTKILEERKIRLSQLENTNDPRESRNWVAPLALLGLPPENFNKDLMDRAISRIKLKEWKVLCVSKHHPRPDKLGIPKNLQSIDPFLLGDSRPNMWAHYGTNHSTKKQDGVCLKFNGSLLHKQIRIELQERCRVFHGPVRYSNRKLYAPFLLPIDYSQFLIEPDQTIRKHLFEYYKEYFLVKSKDWKTEYEYRWVVHSESNIPEHVSIKEGIIEDIVVGADFPDSDKLSLKKQCESLRIRLENVDWVNGIPIPNYGSIYQP